jgi:hypothetical protein
VLRSQRILHILAAENIKLRSCGSVPDLHEHKAGYTKPIALEIISSAAAGLYLNGHGLGWVAGTESKKVNSIVIKRAGNCNAPAEQFSGYQQFASGAC